MVSVIIPTRNRAHVLKRTINSYLIQKSVDEIIIVDDASIDGTEELVQDMMSNFDIIKYRRGDMRQGAAASKRTGFEASKSKYVLFGEDDVELTPLYIKTISEHMRKNQADIVAGRMIYKVRKNGELVDFKSSGPLIDRASMIANYSVDTGEDTKVPFLHAVFLAKREIIEEVEFFNGYAVNGFREETDPQVQALENGAKIVFCPHAVCFHLPSKRSGQRSCSRLVYELWLLRNNYLFLKRHNKFFVEQGYPGGALYKQVMMVFQRFRKNFMAVLRSLR